MYILINVFLEFNLKDTLTIDFGWGNLIFE